MSAENYWKAGKHKLKAPKLDKKGPSPEWKVTQLVTITGNLSAWIYEHHPNLTGDDLVKIAKGEPTEESPLIKLN